jgi:hypothetical protein
MAAHYLPLIPPTRRLGATGSTEAIGGLLEEVVDCSRRFEDVTARWNSRRRKIVDDMGDSEL